MCLCICKRIHNLRLYVRLHEYAFPSFSPPPSPLLLLPLQYVYKYEYIMEIELFIDECNYKLNIIF